MLGGFGDTGPVGEEVLGMLIVETIELLPLVIDDDESSLNPSSTSYSSLLID